MSGRQFGPPPSQIPEFNEAWRNWLYLVYKKLYRKTKDVHLYMSAALSPSIDPMADGLIGLAPVALADDTKDESRNLSMHVFPDWIPGTDINIHVYMINTQAQTGITNVITELTYISAGIGEVMNGAGTTLTDTFSLPNNVAANTLHETGVFTIPASALALDDIIFIKILRRGSSDTCVGDVGYDGVHIRYNAFINQD